MGGVARMCMRVCLDLMFLRDRDDKADKEKRRPIVLLFLALFLEDQGIDTVGYGGTDACCWQYWPLLELGTALVDRCV